MSKSVLNINLRALFLGLAAAAIVASPTGGTQSAAPIPDFSGIWSHPYLTGFEPPQSGPGPVKNKSRRPDGVGKFQQLVGD